MKILALRIRNLASLAGDVTVDFEAPPLAHAGLFAITGPTGAGKSTLLDALCLALYDRLPRLAQASSTKISRSDGAEDSVAGDDVRTILRHGAADGFAEVDFLGRDGGRYRARWQVKRARGKANGRLQSQEISLTDLAGGGQLGGGKRDTLEAIRDKIGLNYDQFRRSVLLAQNEFDAFLRAKSGERAELLELMTGTAIYGELSKAAHERCRDEKAALDQLEAELERVNVLADDERMVVEAEAVAAEEDASRLSAEVEILLRETAWYALATDLAVRAAAAEAQLDNARQAIVADEPERVRVAEVRRALSAAQVVAEVDRLSGDLSRLTAEESHARQGLVESKAVRDTRQSERDAAKRGEDLAEAEFKAAGPLLDRASELDAQIADRDLRLESCRRAVSETNALSTQAQTMCDLLSHEHAACAAKIGKIEDWLSRHQNRKPLADQLDRWLDSIAAYGRAASEKTQAEKAVASCAARAGTLDAENRLGQVRRKAIDDALAEIDEALAEGAGHDVGGLEQQRDRQTGHLGTLEALKAEARTALTLSEREAELAERRRVAEMRGKDAGHKIDALDLRRRDIDAALPEARRALDLAAAAEGEEAAHLRERLMAGEPCPVCGSPDHPLGNVQTVLTALLASHRRRVAELEHEREEVSRRREEASSVQVSAGETLTMTATDAARIDADKAALRIRWGKVRAAIAMDLPQDPFTGVDGAALDAELERIGADLKRIRETLAELRNRGEERDRLRGERQILVDHLAENSRALAEATAGIDRSQADCQRAEGETSRLLDLLSVPLAVVADWRQRLDGDGAVLSDHCRKLAEDWHAGGQTLEVEKDNERKLVSKLESARIALAGAVLNAGKAVTVLADEQAASGQLRQARAELFAGRPTGAVRTAFNDACLSRKAAHQHAQDMWAAADRAHGVAEERLRVLGTNLTAARDGLGRAVAGRDARLAEIGLDLAAVQAALALGDAWVMAAEARQAALRDGEMAAKAVLGERHAAIAAHQASFRPERDEAALAVLMPERIAARDTARDVLSQRRNRLAEDDRNRDAARDTRARIVGQRRRHDLWKGMADLIGSADGKKFRLFAQGLTLDRLLQLANTHLAELTPRYVLQRAPGGDLDLQVVDGDMADEVRGVASLSGGERFLVSLSLALGLARMTGSRTIAESLFIDEGFGALDAESLDVAISALETLHASGRKVGVISHVQPMIDRIGVQIKVSKLGGGRSSVETKAA